MCKTASSSVSPLNKSNNKNNCLKVSLLFFSGEASGLTGDLSFSSPYSWTRKMAGGWRRTTQCFWKFKTPSASSLPPRSPLCCPHHSGGGGAPSRTRQLQGAPWWPKQLLQPYGPGRSRSGTPTDLGPFSGPRPCAWHFAGCHQGNIIFQQPVRWGSLRVIGADTWRGLSWTSSLLPEIQCQGKKQETAREQT